MNVYQVIVAYRVSTWYGPCENADAARARYATECCRFASIRGKPRMDEDVQCVLLTLHGVVVAQATC